MDPAPTFRLYPPESNVKPLPTSATLKNISQIELESNDCNEEEFIVQREKLWRIITIFTQVGIFLL
jgi:hypothetical protein